MSLKEYNRKRNFDQTTEPPGQLSPSAGELRFVIQMHEATRLHFDFRIEFDGTFKSWAVPKGPSLNPNDQRLAVFVEDHPIEYGGFEGIIPKGNYGAGTVMIWDAGTFHERSSATPEESRQNLIAGLAKGHITIVLSGRKIGGEFAFIKIKDSPDPKAWLLVKKRDEFASYTVNVLDQKTSVASGRTINEIAAGSEARNEVWIPGQGAQEPESLNRLLYYTGERLQPLIEKKSSVPTSFSEAELSDFHDAKPERMPRKNKPMFPKHGGSIFRDPDWAFEPAWGGHRAIAEIEAKKVSLYSKQGLDYRKKYPEIHAALTRLNLNAILDGEIVILNNEDIPSAELLHQYSADKIGRPALMIFDLLHLDGKNLRDLPYHLRRQLLAELKVFDKTLILTPSMVDGADHLASEADTAGFSGLVAKHQRSPYVSSTNGSWVRIDLSDDKQQRMPIITHPEKIYWPDDGFTKGDVIQYYEDIADTILPHLKDRPQSLNRHPNGINAESFFQKDMVGYLPNFVSTQKVFSHSSDKSINYFLCQNKESLIYLANLGCIELNPWLARIQHLEEPDYSVIDLDPDTNSFSEVVTVALAVKQVLDAVGAISYIKTSGSSGIHILVPTGGKFSFDINRQFAEEVCRIVNKQMPRLTSIERNPAKRRGRIYLDFMQNRRGQTLAAPYCLRPRPLATASAPLNWHEVTHDLHPSQFTIKNLLQRVKTHGDPWADILTKQVDVETLIEKVRLLPS